MKSTSAADPNGGPSRLLAYAMLAATALFWGGTTVAARAAAGDIPPLTLTFWRWTIAFQTSHPINSPAMASIAAL